MQFVNINFLWAFLLLAIPIFIHLFQFRRFKKVYFSNVAFLKSIQITASSRNKLKHLLVLASRLLALAFLIFAFAQPFIPSKSNLANSGKKYVSLFVDNSFSMNATSNGVSLLDQAKSTALAIVKGYAQNDLFQIITHDFSGKQQRLISKEEAIAAIDEIKPTASSRKWEEIQNRQADILSRDNSPNKIAYLISDLQRSMGKTIVKNGVQFYALPIKAQSINNLYVDTCYFLEPIQLLGQTNKLIVKLRNEGDDDVSNVRVSLSINKQSKALANPSIKSKSTTTDTLVFTVSDAGWNLAEIAVEDYPITFDDKYFISFNVLDVIKVIEYKETNTKIYVGSIFNQSTSFNFTSLPVGNIDYAAFHNTNFFIFSNLKSISSGLSTELKKYIEDGGSVMIFPNENADISSINSFLSSINAGQYGALGGESEGGKINIYQKNIKELFDKIPDNLQLPKVKKYYDYKIGSIPFDDIFTLKNGAKSIIGLKVKEGNLFLSTSPLDNELNEMVVHAMFAPMLYNMGIRSTINSTQVYTIGDKKPIQVSTSIDQRDKVVKLKGDKLELIPEQYTLGNKTFLNPKENLSEAGFYKVFGDNELESQFVAINYNRNESTMNFEDENSISTINPDLKVINTAGMESVSLTNELSRGTPLWRYCLLFCLLFLAVEVFLLAFWKN
jgi:hypothetical protein